MSKLKSCCPVCGANDWKEQYGVEEFILDHYECRNCETMILVKFINRRVGPRWVPVSERQPKKEGLYFTLSTDDTRSVNQFSNRLWWIWDFGRFAECVDCDSERVKYWLEDLTLDKEQV